MALQHTPGDSHVVQLRIERGAVAEAIDGPVGTIEQIIVDRTSGQVSALVIRGSDADTEFELPARYIDVAHSTGEHIRLQVSRRELANNPEMTRPYNPDQYSPVYQGEAVPPGVANRVAAEYEQPVVTDVEEDAAGLLVSEKGPASPHDAMAPAPATGGQTDTDQPVSDTLAREDSTPTVKLNAAQPSTGEAIGGEQRTAPAPETSPTPETTGALMGGKPSTSGMGEKSYVPTSPAPALDTVSTSPNMPPYVNEPREATMATPEEPSAQPATQADVNAEMAKPEGGAPANEPPAPFLADAKATPESVAPPDAALGSGEVPALRKTAVSQAAYVPPASTTARMDLPDITSYPKESASLLEMTPAQPQMLDQFKDRVSDLLMSLGRSPALLLAVGGLAAGITAGIMLRRRPTREAGTSAKRVRDTATQVARSAQDTLRMAGESALAKSQDARPQLPADGDARKQQVKDVAGHVREQAKEAAVQARERAKAGAAQAQEHGKQTARQARKSAKRTARRFRWFRRGVMVGAVVSILFAPQPGAALRSRLASVVEEWRSRIA